MRVVPVTVDVIASPTGTITVSCTPPTATVDPGASNVLLTFTLATSGYRFKKTKAIAMDVPADDFPYASWTINDTTAALYDSNKIADKLKYTVTVVNNTTGKHYAIDPEIQNGGGGGGGAEDC
jgi:hypothetical protein